MTMSHMPCHGAWRNNRPTPQPPTEPPDEPARCLWCDGQGEVTVHAVLDVSGQVQSVWSLPNATSIEVACSRCEGTGAEPPPDPMDDPRIP